jgi:hypothetical protein
MIDTGQWIGSEFIPTLAGRWLVWDEHMTTPPDSRTKQTAGAWIVHHGHKVAADINGASEFPALDTSAKAAALLSQLAATEEMTIDKKRVSALARAAKLNPRTELPTLLGILRARRLIDLGATGDVAVLGLTTRAALGHASDIFDAEAPTIEERAAIDLAERSSKAPLLRNEAEGYVSDSFRLTRQGAKDFLQRAEVIGFIDTEGRDGDKLYFNGNLFRRNAVVKAKRVLDSLSVAESALANELRRQAPCASN